MTVAAGIPPELESYLAAVREALADLPPPASEMTC